MVTATRDAEAIHDTPPPRDRTEYRPEPMTPASGPTSRAIVTTGPTMSTPAATMSTPAEPPRPTAPPRHGTAARPSEDATRAEIAASADPSTVEAAARRAFETLTSTVTPVVRANAVRAFQAAYGRHGMTGTGRNAGAYGNRTRTAMALILGRPTSELPSITVDD
jgi:hypothetical protein